MMNRIWLGLLAIGVLWGICTGRGEAVTQAALSGAQNAVSTAVLLAGGYMLWMGLLNILEKAGGLRALAKALRPVLQKLFPGVPKDSEAEKQIAANLSANLLGLGNAATPAGIAAMKELSALSPGDTASDDMALFLVANSCSLQLLPTTVIALRAAAGAAEPAAVLPRILFATAVTAVVGIGSARLFARLSRLRKARTRDAPRGARV